MDRQGYPTPVGSRRSRSGRQLRRSHLFPVLPESCPLSICVPHEECESVDALGEFWGPVGHIRPIGHDLAGDSDLVDGPRSTGDTRIGQRVGPPLATPSGACIRMDRRYRVLEAAVRDVVLNGCPGGDPAMSEARVEFPANSPLRRRQRRPEGRLVRINQDRDVPISRRSEMKSSTSGSFAVKWLRRRPP